MLAVASSKVSCDQAQSALCSLILGNKTSQENLLTPSRSELSPLSGRAGGLSIAARRAGVRVSVYRDCGCRCGR
jgi:hypothetical protein